MYCLVRDDGVELRLSGGTWESALEVAFFHGWKPAGTERPETTAWRARRAARPTPWDRRDYFSREFQHVERDDARALSTAVRLALVAVPDAPTASAAPSTDSPLPSRASVVAEGLSEHRRKAMGRLADFAGRGGFTIGGDA